MVPSCVTGLSKNIPNQREPSKQERHPSNGTGFDLKIYRDLLMRFIRLSPHPCYMQNRLMNTAHIIQKQRINF